MLRRARWVGLLAATLWSAGIGVAQAQSLDGYLPPGVPGYGTAPGVTVLSRARPEYDSLGVRLGDFIVHPSLDMRIGADSNVEGRQGGAGSWIAGVSPGIAIAGGPSGTTIGAYAGLDDRRYLDLPGDSYTNGTAALGVSHDFGQDRLTLSATHLSLHALNTAIGAVSADRPIAFRAEDVRARYRIAAGPLSIVPAVDFTAYRFAPARIGGMTVSQAFRDRNVWDGSLTLRYELAPQRATVLVLRSIRSDYLTGPPGFSHSGTGYEILAGFDVAANAVLRYRALAGYEMRRFDSRAFKTHVAPIVEAQVIWNPSGLTTLTGTLSRSIEDAAEETIGGYTLTRGRIVLDHEYLPNVLLQARAEVQHAAYRQGGGRQTILGAGGGVDWLLNRRMRISADYDFADQQASHGGDYARSTVSLRLHLGL